LLYFLYYEVMHTYTERHGSHIYNPVEFWKISSPLSPSSLLRVFLPSYENYLMVHHKFFPPIEAIYSCDIFLFGFTLLESYNMYYFTFNKTFIRFMQVHFSILFSFVFLSSIIMLYKYIRMFSPFSHWWTFELFCSLDHYEWKVFEHP
jgi:hypothetical protein